MPNPPTQEEMNEFLGMYPYYGDENMEEGRKYYERNNDYGPPWGLLPLDMQYKQQQRAMEQKAMENLGMQDDY